MDIQTKEQFLKEYDEYVKKVYMGDTDKFSENCWNWLDFLSNTNIPLIQIVLIWVTDYRSFDVFHNEQKKLFSIQSTSNILSEVEDIFFWLEKVEKKYHFWDHFVFLKYGIDDSEKENRKLYSITHYDCLFHFNVVSRSFREIFKRCLDLPDVYPTVDRDAQREIPASDRIVKINHNAPEYQEIIEKLEELEASISKSNTVENEDKDRLQAELKAGEGILKGKTARIEVIKTLLVKGLKYIIEHVADVAIVITAEYLLKLIFQYFGLTV